MQSISIFKPEASKEYKKDTLESIRTTNTITLNGVDETLQFEMYFNEQIGDYIYCHIRMDEPFSIKGRVLQTDITEIVITGTYDALLNTKEGNLLVLANKNSADLITSEFSKKMDVDYIKVELDLQKVILNATNVKRTQFRGLRIETINGSSLSGNRVTDTELYRTMLDAGELSTIAVSYPFDGMDVSFSISSSGSMVLFSTMTVDKILEFLDLLLKENY